MDKTKCSAVQQSVDWCEGAPNYAGIKRKVLYTAASNIIKWPARKLTDSGRELAEYDDKAAFTLKADKKFYRIDCLPQKSSATSEPQGETPSRSQLNKLELVHPGTAVESSNIAAYINNVPCVFLVQDMNVPNAWRVFGCERWAGEIKNTVAQDLGQGSAGEAKTTISVEAPDTTPAPYYYGDIDEDSIEVPDP